MSTECSRERRFYPLSGGRRLRQDSKQCAPGGAAHPTQGETYVSAIRKSSLSALAAFAALVTGVALASPAQAVPSARAPVIVNEVYGGGGNSGAAFNRDFIELYNPTDAAVHLTAWSCSTRRRPAAAGRYEPDRQHRPRGGYYLVAEATGANAAPACPRPTRRHDPDERHGGQGRARLDHDRAHLQLDLRDLAEVVDLVGYGPRRTPSPAPARRPRHEQLDLGGARPPVTANTANNAADFAAAPRPRRTRPPRPTGRSTRRWTRGATIAEIQGTGDDLAPRRRDRHHTGVVTAAYPTGGFNGYVHPDPRHRRRDRRGTHTRVRRRLRLLVGDRRLGRDRRPRPGHRRGQRVQRPHRDHRPSAAGLEVTAGRRHPSRRRRSPGPRTNAAARGARVDALRAAGRLHGHGQLLHEPVRRGRPRRRHDPAAAAHRGRPPAAPPRRRARSPTTRRAASCSTTARRPTSCARQLRPRRRPTSR